MNADPKAAKAIFLEAVERHAPEQWPAFLERACAGQPDLRGQVEALLEAHREVGTAQDRELPEGADPGLVATVDVPSPGERPGEVIGPYKLLEHIGEGGMGTVWMAQQTAPVKRRVAVKLIKPGLDSRQVLARFEAERQALALMDHPSIAKVLDAGAAADGRPFFVMELVKGVPITTYCDARRLTPRARLELFVPVCQAVQHAHQKGVIHRDLKPSNVLVAEYDGVPVPKVIDFGVAKAAGQPLTERTLHTGFGAVVGTPEYMSPEQAGFNQLDIDTRSDIYALGVLLYELLAGSPPFPRKELERAGVLEMLRVIREREPPKPSTRLSTSEGLPTLAANRGTEPGRLAKLVRGELDWIVMKALEKDRSRRYETANGFATDVQRYLADEPVQACPPSAGYRLGKFVRRNRGPVATAVALALSLVVGVVGLATVLAVQTRANSALKQANDATEKALGETKEAKKATDAALAQSEESRKQAEAVSGFLVETFRSPDPSQTGRDVRVADVLDRAADKLDKEFIGSQATQAALLQALGRTYYGLGLYDKAVMIFTKAHAVHEAALGPDHPHTLTSRNNLAVAYYSAGRLSEAIALHQATLGLREAKLGPDHPDTLKSRSGLANAYWAAGRLSEAIALHQATLKFREAKQGPDHPDTLQSRNNLGIAYWSAGRTAEAIALHEETLKLTKAKLGPDHPETLNSRNNLAIAYQTAGRFSEAIALHEATRKLMEAKLGPDHPDTLTSRGNLAGAFRDAGRLWEAVTLFESTRPLQEVKLGPDHPFTLNDGNNLASAYESLGRWPEAERLLRDVLARRRRTNKPDSPMLAADLAQLGRNLLMRSRWSEAEPLLREGLAIRAKATPDEWDRHDTASLLGGSLLGQGRYTEAEPLIVPGYEEMKAREARIPVPERFRLREAAERVIRLYEEWDKPEEAAAWKVKLGLPDLPADVFARK